MAATIGFALVSMVSSASVRPGGLRWFAKLGDIRTGAEATSVTDEDRTFDVFIELASCSRASDQSLTQTHVPTR